MTLAHAIAKSLDTAELCKAGGRGRPGLGKVGIAGQGGNDDPRLGQEFRLAQALKSHNKLGLHGFSSLE